MKRKYVRLKEKTNKQYPVAMAAMERTMLLREAQKLFIEDADNMSNKELARRIAIKKFANGCD